MKIIIGIVFGIIFLLGINPIFAQEQTSEETRTSDYLSFFALLTSVSLVIFIVWYNKSHSKEQRRANTVYAFTEIVNQIGNEKARDSRRIIRKSTVIQDQKMNPKSIPPTLTTIEEEACRYVAITYDRLGFILKHDPDFEIEILEFHGDVIAEMWETLCPFIKKWREYSPFYTNQFERLGGNAVEYLKNNPPRRKS